MNNFLKIAGRHLIKNKIYSAINISGLAVGFALTLLISLWIYDEITYNRVHQNYDRIAQVMQHNTFNGERISLIWNPYLLGEILRKEYNSDFKYIVMTTSPAGHVLFSADNKFVKEGAFMEWETPMMLSLNMIRGSQDGLKSPYGILISKSTAKVIFGETDPINQTIRIDNQADLKVTGVFEDIANNSNFSNLKFIASWDLYLKLNPGVVANPDPWSNNNFHTYVQISETGDASTISSKIKDIKAKKIDPETAVLLKPEFFLHPMAKWHLYSEFKNGINTGGLIQYVWLLGITGAFVLLLACINFINLSTARSQTRSKEVGIRKTLGSLRHQLMGQFFLESLLTILLSFFLSLIFSQILFSYFNVLASKTLSIPWSSIWFWLTSLAFCFVIALLAGAYPSFYLSSFQPLTVLKGGFKMSLSGAFFRKTLVFVQFVLSLVLIIGSMVVFRQIEFAKDRPIGYKSQRLIEFASTDQIHSHFEAFRNELMSSNAVVEVAEAANPIAGYYVSDNRFKWEGKDPSISIDFPISNVTHQYGKTVGWEIAQGRDFSAEYASDSSAFIINEAAVKFMGLKEPIGSIINWNEKPFRVIGVIKDIIYDSPYQPVTPYIFQMTGDLSLVVTVRLSSGINEENSLTQVKSVFDKYNPELPFDYKFMDDEFARKFEVEERIGKVAGFGTFIAILISALGVFGLSAFIAEQRIKEIGLRKVLGASVLSIWTLLLKDFVILVLMALVIAGPVAYYATSSWLENYQYRTPFSWWIFGLSGLVLMAITLLTVSFQTLKAAIVSPVKSLRAG